MKNKMTELIYSHNTYNLFCLDKHSDYFKLKCIFQSIDF